MSIKPRLSVACFFILTSLSPYLFAAESHLLLLKSDDLNYTLQQTQQNNPQYEKAYKNLISKADKSLKNPLYSVMDKTLVAASGDKHDYYSFPPYWWPDPSKKDGLPYLRKDGETNPDANSSATDKSRLNSFSAIWRWLIILPSSPLMPKKPAISW